jgi:hypothetical protein
MSSFSTRQNISSFNLSTNNLEFVILLEGGFKGTLRSVGLVSHKHFWVHFVIVAMFRAKSPLLFRTIRILQLVVYVSLWVPCLCTSPLIFQPLLPKWGLFELRTQLNLNKLGNKPVLGRNLTDLRVFIGYYIGYKLKYL